MHKNNEDYYTTGEEDFTEFRKHFVYKPGEYEEIQKNDKGKHGAGRLSRFHPGSKTADKLIVLGHYQRTEQISFGDFKIAKNPEEFAIIEKRVNDENRKQCITHSFKRLTRQKFTKQ